MKRPGFRNFTRIQLALWLRALPYHLDSVSLTPLRLL
jgi:hypothetical protein